jgi:hypothetical protein
LYPNSKELTTVTKKRENIKIGRWILEGMPFGLVVEWWHIWKRTVYIEAASINALIWPRTTTSRKL